MRSLLFFLCLSTTSLAQTITLTQQKALNSYVEYANQSADEVTAVVKSIISYYPSIHQKNSWSSPRYTCPVQLEDYYLNTAIKEGKTLSATVSTGLNVKLNELRAAAEKIDARCKALDTYHKLEDYKQDNFVKAETLINELQLLIAGYKKSQDALSTELQSAYKKLNAGAPETSYTKADAMLKTHLLKEKAFLELCSFNLKEEIHTGWPVEKLQQSISETNQQLEEMKKFNPTLKYPASSMWGSIEESLGSILEAKRTGLDEYNFEAKKSDKHSNDVYLGLINYYNGTLISFQNMFIQYAQTDGFHGLKAIKYFPVYDIRSQAQTVAVEVKPFKDITHNPITFATQKTTISKSQLASLTNYVDLINETYRQTRYLKMVLVSFNSSAAYYKGLDNFDRRGAMSFDYKNFQAPLSQYQKTLVDSKALPPAVAKTLNEQSDVIMSIIKEMDDLCALIEIETREKRYEQDHLKKIYEILERQKVLMDAWDTKKELLYDDLVRVFDAYPLSQPANSWTVSGKALRNLTVLDHDALFQAKDHYSGNTHTSIPTEKIDAALRDVISKEYDNMKGIEKYGRSNGLCPYTPYEDLPASSKSLSEELQKLKPYTSSSNDHPYHRMVYQYNDIVEDYNKFCELSKDIPQLKTVKQPELFAVQYPTATREKQSDPTMPTAKQEAKQAPVIEKIPEKKVKEQEVTQQQTQPQQPVIRNTQTTRVEHDTVYIERRDTVYMAEPGENIRSMEGYATNNVVLLLDVSGSMNSPEKLPILKSSVIDLLSMMRQEDQISIIAFSEKPKALLTATSFKERSKITKAINDLKSLGKTDGNAGVKLAYKVADENYIRGGNNRIILATDGEFNLNDETRSLIQRFSGEDIFLSIFNFGKGMGASKVLQSIATMGKGNYQYISKQNVDLQLIREVKAKKKK